MSNAISRPDLFSVLPKKIATLVADWRLFVGRSPLRKMGHSAMVAAAASLVAKGLGFVKEIAVAAYFGLSGALDVYLLAFVLIGFPLSILLNAIQTAFISRLSGHARSSEEAAQLYVTTALLTLTAMAVLLPLWLLLLHPLLPWLASGFSVEKKQALETALFWLIPYYFLNGLNLLGYGTLQAKGRYLANGLLPTASPLTTILMLAAWGGTDDWHILVYALVAGAAAECALLLLVLQRNSLLRSPHFQGVTGLKPVFGASLVLLPGTIMLAVGPVIEQAIAASMGEGTIAALGYGYKLPAALQGIFVTAIGITVLPYFASLIAQQRIGYCLHSLEKLAFWLLMGGASLALPLSAFSGDLVALMYQRGAFDVAASMHVAPIQVAYFLQLPFALVAMMGLRTLAALGHNGLMSACTAVAVVLQSALAYGLGLRFGASGIAWAAALVSALLAATSFFTARAMLNRLPI